MMNRTYGLLQCCVGFVEAAFDRGNHHSREPGCVCFSTSAEIYFEM